MTEENFNKLVGKNIKRQRLLYNANYGVLTQKELAKRVGVSISLIGALESKNLSQGISMYNLYKISEVLNCPIDEFFKTLE